MYIPVCFERTCICIAAYGCVCKQRTVVKMLIAVRAAPEL